MPLAMSLNLGETFQALPMTSLRNEGIIARVAMVTGASRGIGKASAIALAAAGLDVAITARTLREGDGIDSSDTGEGRTIPGSLEQTAKEIASLGAKAY